ncbi:MAG: hypothetical protein ING44_12190 [Telmatospirillum sp.]|nr:hypothetical protein [Telmatospirillum sp.]
MIGDHRVSYISRARMESSGLNGADFLPAIDEVFRLHAAGECLMPDPIFMPRESGRFCNALFSWVPKWGYASGKLQMGDPSNLDRGRPQVQGLLTLFDDASSLPIAVMEAGWITALRSAAVSGIAAQRFAHSGSKVLGLVGAGLQARLHWEMLPQLVPSLERCVAYDVFPERAEAFAAHARARGGLPVEVAETAEAAVRRADILVTATVILPKPRPFIAEAWLKRDCLVFALDRDCCFEESAVQSFALVVSDDRTYFDHAKTEEGAFASVSHLDLDVSEMLTDGANRPSVAGRIAMFAIGVPIADLAGAVTVWRKFGSDGEGFSF